MKCNVVSAADRFKPNSSTEVEINSLDDLRKISKEYQVSLILTFEGANSVAFNIPLEIPEILLYDNYIE